MERNSQLVSWILCAAAAAIWIGVGFFAYSISAMQSQRTLDLQSAQSQSSQAVQASFTHSFVAKTAAERSELDTLSRVDPSEFAQLITGAGSGSGIALSITSATQQPSVPLDAGAVMNSYVFLASSHGSFDSVIQAAKLLETLPAPSTLGQMEFTRAPSNPGVPGSSGQSSQWVMNAQIQVFSESST